jgi:hypothetical protein
MTSQLLRTADSVSPSLTGKDVLIPLAGYILAYLIMFPPGTLIMARLVRKGPSDSATGESPIEGGRPDLLVRTLPTAKERREDVRGNVREPAPIGSELERHDNSGDHAHSECDRKILIQNIDDRKYTSRPVVK